VPNLVLCALDDQRRETRGCLLESHHTPGGFCCDQGKRSAVFDVISCGGGKHYGRHGIHTHSFGAPCLVFFHSISILSTVYTQVAFFFYSRSYSTQFLQHRVDRFTTEDPSSYTQLLPSTRIYNTKPTAPTRRMHIRPIFLCVAVLISLCNSLWLGNCVNGHRRKEMALGEAIRYCVDETLVSAGLKNPSPKQISSTPPAVTTEAEDPWPALLEANALATEVWDPALS
jgi:hypothetical protein